MVKNVNRDFQLKFGRFHLSGAYYFRRLESYLIVLARHNGNTGENLLCTFITPQGSLWLTLRAAQCSKPEWLCTNVGRGCQKKLFVACNEYFIFRFSEKLAPRVDFHFLF